MKNILISLFDFTGNASRPYLENGWIVYQVDIKNGIDILSWDYESVYKTNPGALFGIIAMIPCTDYALSGACWFAKKDIDGRTAKSQELVKKTKEIIDFFKSKKTLLFWQIENPMSRIHKLNTWMGSPVLKFNPCDFAGYSDNPQNDRYNKQTWIWGEFSIPEKKYLPPLQKEFPGHLKLGGKSERTKELRSITPMGFSYAFYKYNN